MVRTSILLLLIFFTRIAIAGESILEAPVADNQNLVLTEDTPLPLTLTGSDLDGNTLTYSIVGQPLHGVLSGTGSNLTYTPYSNYFGSDTFTFKANDGSSDSNTATVSLTITPVNDSPSAFNQNVTAKKNTPKQITLNGSDVEGDALVYSINTQPTHGTLSGALPIITYTPDMNYAGSDSFVFEVSDVNGVSDMATVSITVEQANRYMVFFTDKANTPHSVSSPLTFLSQRAIDRRTAQEISITEEDLPVNPAYVQGLRDEGINVLYKTKWMNGVLVECTASEASDLTSLSFVNSIEYTAPGSRPPVNGRIKSSSKFNSTTSTTASTDVQISMLGMEKMHSDGLRGEGMLIAVMDSGFPGADTISYFKHVFNDGRLNINASYNFVHGVSNVFKHDAHGTNTWSIIAGYKQGTFEGGAHKANFVLFVTEDTFNDNEYRVEEYNWLFAAERADSVGVDVISTSLGYSTFDDASMDYVYASDMDGETTAITRASKIAASKGMAIVVSAGNEGTEDWRYITAPADAIEVLAVGAVSASGTKSNFSSYGPSADGRFKPDVAAMGSSVSIVNPNGLIGAGSGTSFAAPLMASFVTCYWQKLRHLPVQALLDTVRRRGSQFNNPDNSLGFGIPTYYDNITAVELNKETFVQVYPNPSSGEVILEFTDGRDIDFTTSLVSIKGETMWLTAESLGQHKFRIDLAGQSAGMYALKIYRDKQISVYKILKTE